jgi:hypothetical protein
MGSMKRTWDEGRALKSFVFTNVGLAMISESYLSARASMLGEIIRPFCRATAMRRRTVTIQKSLLFMAFPPFPRQWICHKTDALENRIYRLEKK